MSRKNTINGAAYRMDYAADYILEKYKGDGYEAQKLSFDVEGSSGRLVQICNTQKGILGTLKATIGLKTCATLKMVEKDGDLEVEVFGGSWLDKGALAAVATFVALGVLLIPAGIGTFKQKKLLDDLYEDTLCYFAGSHNN